MSASLVFDQQHYEELNRARGAIVSRLLAELKREGLRTAIDVGCGLGYFSGLLASCGLDVTGVDGREQNACEAQKRYPTVRFIRSNVEDPEFAQIGRFDLVLCFGLLYHLENPFRAIRNLYALTGRVLLVESMCAPGLNASMELLDEYHGDDQGLDYVAFYPTEACLVKMLFRSGFSFVYKLANPPCHEDFRDGRRHKARTMLVACKERIDVAELVPLNEATRPWDIWSTARKPWRQEMRRAGRFLVHPWSWLRCFARNARESRYVGRGS